MFIWWIFLQIITIVVSTHVFYYWRRRLTGREKSTAQIGTVTTSVTYYKRPGLGGSILRRLIKNIKPQNFFVSPRVYGFLNSWGWWYLYSLQVFFIKLNFYLHWIILISSNQLRFLWLLHLQKFRNFSFLLCYTIYLCFGITSLVICIRWSGCTHSHFTTASIRQIRPHRLPLRWLRAPQIRIIVFLSLCRLSETEKWGIVPAKFNAGLNERGDLARLFFLRLLLKQGRSP